MGEVRNLNAVSIHFNDDGNDVSVPNHGVSKCAERKAKVCKALPRSHRAFIQPKRRIS
jgi:hypothetical protein